MADYATLKAAIQAVIYENGNQEITGSVMQATLLAMVNSLGANYQYAGIATPSTNPGTPDQNVFYLASTAGTYVNFGNIVLGDGEVAILKYNGNWAKDSTGIASSGKVDSIIYQKGDPISISATAESWQLNGDGFCRSNLNARMRKYLVSQGQIIYLKLSKDTPGVYQFQDRANVPSSGTSYVIGTPVTEAVDGFVTVPTGATHLIVSELKTNTTNEVKYATDFREGLLSQSTILINALQFKDNRYINNNGVYVDDANWAVTPKIACPQGSQVVWASGYNTSSSVISIVIFNAAGEKLAYYARSNQTSRSFTVTQVGAAYVIASFYKGSTDGYLQIDGEIVAKMDANTLLKLSEQTVEVLDNDIIANNLRKEPALASVVAYFGNSALKIAGKITLLHISDIHGNTANLSRIVRYKKYYQSLFSDTIHTGDTVAGLFSDSDPFQNVPRAGDILNVIGNHDAWLSASDSDYNATEKQCYDKFFAPNIANWNVVQPAGAAANGYCYYYKDYPTEGYRLIVLDSVHWHYRNGVSQQNAAQKTWFENTLADAKTQGLTVICATHYTPQNGITPIPDTGFNLMGATPGGNIADGWYASDEMFDCVDDFISAGGIFAGWLIGHTHTDYIGTVYGHDSQPIVIMGTSGNTSVNNKFIAGTASQDNFNAITFENIRNKAVVKIVKIGQDTDLYTRSKQTIAYNFTDGILISTT